MELLKPTSAFVETMYVGTNRLGRALNPDETKALSSFLRKHDFAGASLAALNFAFKLSRNSAGARDLIDRAHTRLVEQGWDPRVVPLAQRLCRFVWSEQKNERRELAAASKAEQVFGQEQAIHLSAAPSAEDAAVRLETQREHEERARARSSALRKAFVEAGDAINQLWLDYWIAGVDEPAEMARLSGHDVSDFYRAAERRKRHVARLLAAERATSVASGARVEESE